MKKEFKDILKELRKEKGLSQEGLGEILNVSRSAIAKYENGLGLPSEDVIESMTKYFKVTKEYLFPLDDVLEIITDKNIKIKKEKKKFIVVMSSLVVVILFLLGTIFGITQTLNPDIVLDDAYSSLDISEEECLHIKQSDSFFRFKGGYVYQDIEIVKVEFTGESNLYFLRVSNSYTNGHVASSNDSPGFSEKELTERVYLKIDFEDSRNNIKLIDASPLKQSKYFQLSSYYSDDKILIEEDVNLYDGVCLEKLEDKLYYVFVSDVHTLLFDKDYNKQLRKLDINSGEFNTSWEYEMLQKNAKWTTFTLYASYLFEAKPGQVIKFNIHTKMYTTNMSCQQKNIIELTI